MKATTKILILSIILHSTIWIAPQKATAQVSINFQVFYDDLSPYGTWIDNPDYGYVWIPRVSSGFTPYGTNGYWAFTDEGWTWVSYYSWGWAPFHYGRWYYDAVYGSVWVPGNEWGPGWVTWRRSDGYYGWAPIGPGISTDMAYSSSYTLPYNQWRFVRDRDFGRTNITNYYISSSGNTTIINNSTVINNVHNNPSGNVRYNQGPDRIEVEKHAGKKFTPMVIKENSKPGQHISKNELQLYRPRVQNNPAGTKSAPSKVTNSKDVKPAPQKNIKPESPKENKPIKQQANNHPVKQKQIQQKHIEQPVKQQPPQQKRVERPVKQQPPQQKRIEQPVKQQPLQQKRIEQPVKQQPPQQHNNQPAKQRPAPQKHDH